MADDNPPITVRVDPAYRPALRRYAKMLRVSEGKLLAMSFEDLSEMVTMPGEEKLPHVVHLIRAACHYDDTKPKLASYRRSAPESRHGACLNESKGKK